MRLTPGYLKSPRRIAPGSTESVNFVMALNHQLATNSIIYKSMHLAHDLVSNKGTLSGPLPELASLNLQHSQAQDHQGSYVPALRTHIKCLLAQNQACKIIGQKKELHTVAPLQI